MSSSQSTVILLVDDDPGDVMLTKRAFQECDSLHRLHVASDGVEALSFLKNEGSYATAPRPDLIVLDLNMPRMDGRETLSEIKQDQALRSIPVVVLTTSDAHQDVFSCYDCQASCFITKPSSLQQFTSAVRSINDFWLAVVRYPRC